MTAAAWPPRVLLGRGEAESMWTVQTPQGGSNRVTHCPGRSTAQMEAMVDSYHFFGRAPPWGGDCGA